MGKKAQQAARREHLKSTGKRVGLVLVATVAVYAVGFVHGREAETTSSGSELVATEIQLAASSSGGPKRVKGVCGVFDGRLTAYACVPVKSPKGSPLVKVSEDGSARYKDGSVFDAEDNVFRKG